MCLQTSTQRYTKVDAIVETATRLLFLPAYLARWFLQLPDRVVLREPDHYGRCRWQEPYAESARLTPTTNVAYHTYRRTPHKYLYQETVHYCILLFCPPSGKLMSCESLLRVLKCLL